MNKIAFLTLITTLFSSITVAKTSTPHDIGVTNKERILYWLNKKEDLTSDELEASYNEYINNKSPVQVALKNGFSQLSRLSTYNSIQKGLLPSEQSSFSSELTPDDRVNTVKVLTILVDFPDLKHNENQLTPQDTDMFYTDYSPDHYQQMLFNTNGYEGPDGQVLLSAADYYKAASGNSLNFEGQVYGWVTANNNAKFYGERLGSTRDKNAPSLVKEAVEKAVAQFNINLADYDLTDLDDIDGDGITDEPNGIIDHVMIFHSSIGEESGGGYLSTDAIWSHRYYVLDENSQPTEVVGSDIKLFGYTINPIDAAIGVVVHEFGHDLGLKDEYDLQSNTVGEPVASWSVMSSGTWAGSPRGSEPVMFSPYALEYLQTRYQGNWVNQLSLNMDEVVTNPVQVINNASSTSKSQSQVKVTLPPSLEKFKTPVEGVFQYYSNTGDNLNTRLVNTINLPSTTESLMLSFVAFYSIEQDYDLVQIKVNGVPIAGNYTQPTNPYYGNIGHYITGDSFLNPDAQLPNGYLTHQFDLSAYAGQTIELQVQYLTDANTHYYGFVIDDMRIEQNGSLIWQNNAETQSNTTLSGFAKVGSYVFAMPSHYYLQLRDYSGIDSGLQKEGYSPGLLLWYSDKSYTDNNTTEHPGSGFALVVDADQRAINKGGTQSPANTAIQIRDAAFSLYGQRAGLGDDDLSAISSFSDEMDYGFAEQAESGVKLPQVGFGFRLTNQENDNQSIEILLNYEPSTGISYSLSDFTADFKVDGLTLSPSDTFTWDFGDGRTSSELSPSHVFESYGRYDVTFTASNGEEEQVATTTVIIAAPLSITEIDYEITQGLLTAKAEVAGGLAPYSYLWSLGDGSSLASQSISYDYLHSGDYFLSLTVTDDQGMSVSQNVNVNVNVPLAVNTGFSTNNLTVQFNADVIGGFKNYTYSWDFGDGSELSQVQNPGHTYQNAGSYSVTLTITDTITGEVISDDLSVTVAQSQTNSGSSSSGGALGGLLIFMLLISIRFKRA
ncbi:immune inhibitor A [Pseudoalteromonas marina]|nr:immune inhibitor A [Pseudoalteromonas marina]